MLLSLSFLFGGVISLLANTSPSATGSADGPVRIEGVMLDEATGEPLIGAVASLPGTQYYAMTDLDGLFVIELPSSLLPADVEFSLMGYTTQVIRFEGSKKVTIRLHLEAQMLEDAQVIAYGKQSKMSITGSISSIDTKELLKSPSGSAAGALAGAVPGVSTVQASGQPGAEDPIIYVRGSGSLTDAASQPLILVDGVERSFFQMDPNEIESITVLKDAASTAVFGVRGANGVILVTTRRGKEGRNQIAVNSSFGLTQALRNLYGVSSYDYATLYTEAQKNDNPKIKNSELAFSPYVTELFRTGADPVMFPNVEWNDYLFKNLAWQTQHNVTMSGGGKHAKYFISAGFMHQDGMMKQYNESYNSNFTYNRYNLRANVDVNITPTTVLSANIGTRIGVQSAPNNYDIWRNIMWCTPFASAGFVDGKRIYNPNNPFIILPAQTSGLDLYYDWGYNKNTENVMNLDFILNQDLGMLTEGLTLTLKGAYNTNYNASVNREVVGGDSAYTPVYVGTLTQPGMDISNPLFKNEIVYRTTGVTGLHQPMTYGEGYWQGRNWYLEGAVNWSRSFGKSDWAALLLYNQSRTYYPGAYSDIPTGYVGYVGRLTYNYDKKYLFDFNVGYNGSENFAPGHRYGFFPAGSVGWIISSEKFMKPVRFINFLKVRASYGIVGNDKYAGDRFLYMPNSWAGNSGAINWGTYQFGIGDTSGMLTDAHELSNGNPVVSWEKCSKQNYGLELKMFDYRFSMVLDVFFEHRWDILTTRNTLPSITSVKLPLMNLGIVNNKGYELQLGWNDKVGEFGYNINANMSFARNKIIYKDEVIPNEPYMAETGNSTGRFYGYMFDRFLQESDFDASGKINPELPTMAIGNPKPGDVLYKDLNDDGKVDGDDCTYFGWGTRPEYVFGVTAGLNWKGLSFSMQWTGATHASRLLSGEYREPFGTTNSRAMLQYLADGRWTPENAENARFPRLTFSSKSHNYRLDSDLWMMDGSYLRLKVAELGYTFSDNPVLKKAGISSFKLFVSGYNLLTLFSDLAEIDIDPEQYTGGEGSSAYAYPNNKIYNFGINITF